MLKIENSLKAVGALWEVKGAFEKVEMGDKLHW